MHFDRRFVLVISMSLAWALLVSGAFYRLAGGAGGRARAASGKQVVVATRALGVGSMLDRDSVKLRGVPDGLFPAGAFSRVEDVLERPVISAIQADEPLVEARLAVKGSGMGLGPMIPPGMRAIAVRVNDVVGVAGFVLPGMRVDVLVTGRGHDVEKVAEVLIGEILLSARRKGCVSVEVTVPADATLAACWRRHGFAPAAANTYRVEVAVRASAIR